MVDFFGGVLAGYLGGSPKGLDVMGRFEIPNAGRGIRRVHLVTSTEWSTRGATVSRQPLRCRTELRMSTQEAEVGILT